MQNRINIMGRLVGDPELRYTKNSTPVCSCRIACERDYKNADGERETDFIDVVAWRNLAENMAQYFSKGRMAIIDGRLQIRPWTGRDGTKHYATEILASSVYFGDSKPAGTAEAAEPAAVGAGYTDDYDEKLPF